MPDWTEEQLDALSRVNSPADTEEAAAQWRQDAPREARTLLDAQEAT